MKKTCLFILLLVISFPLISCADRNYQNPKDFNENKPQGTCGLYFSKTEVCVDLTWVQKPTDTESGIFDLQFYDKNSPDDAKSPNHNVSVLLWMPSMGHGSSPVTVTEVGVGLYRATNVFFVMKGEWEIHVQIKDGDKLVEEVVQKIAL